MKSAPIVSLSQFERRNWAYFMLDDKRCMMPDNVQWRSPNWEDRVIDYAERNHKLNLLLSRPTKESDCIGDNPLFAGKWIQCLIIFFMRNYSDH